MSESEPVGSVSEEAFKLFRALSSSATEATADEPHSCNTPWCPVCQVVGLVRDNPDAVAQVSASAVAFAKSLRDLVDSVIPPGTAPSGDENA